MNVRPASLDFVSGSIPSSTAGTSVARLAGVDAAS